MRHFAALAAVVPLVAGHGLIKSPPHRLPGDAYEAACGQQPFYQQSSDVNGNVQGIMQVVGSDFNAAECNLWLCKGFQFDDNTDNVQSYTLGQTIDFEINIAAPHTGVANVSVVKTSTNSLIGTPLIEFTNYASNNGVDANNTAFSVTMPSSLGGDCTTAGDCVLQWFWNAADINQTYESCVDFTVGSGSGSGSGGDTGAGSTTVAVTTAAATTQVVPTTTPVLTTPVPTTPVPILTTAITPSPIANGTTTTPPPTQTTDLPDDDCSGDDGDDGEDDGDDGEDDGTGDDDCSGDDDDTGDEDDGDDDDCEDDGSGDEDNGSSGGADDADPEDQSPTSEPGPIVTLTTSIQPLAQPTTFATVVVTVTAAPVTVTAQPSDCAA